MPRPTAAIVGASRDHSKYGNISLRAHRDAGYEVFPVNPNAAAIEGVTAYASLAALPVDHVDRVSLYVPPEVGMTLLSEIAALTPDELWLNPGADSDHLAAAARALGLNVIEGCSIVDVNLRRGAG